MKAFRGWSGPVILVAVALALTAAFGSPDEARPPARRDIAGIGPLLPSDIVATQPPAFEGPKGAPTGIAAHERSLLALTEIGEESWLWESTDEGATWKGVVAGSKGVSFVPTRFGPVMAADDAPADIRLSPTRVVPRTKRPPGVTPPPGIIWARGFSPIFIDARTAFAIKPSEDPVTRLETEVLRTQDGGENWSTAPILKDIRIDDIDAGSAGLIGTAQTTTCKVAILLSTDSARTWSQRACFSSEKPELFSGLVVRRGSDDLIDAYASETDNRGYFSASLRLSSRDGGATWLKELVRSEPIETATYVDDMHGWATTGCTVYGEQLCGPYIARTEAGGQRWRPTGFPADSVAALSPLVALAFGEGSAFGADGSDRGALWVTRDAGDTWHPLTDPVRISHGDISVGYRGLLTTYSNIGELALTTSGSWRIERMVEGLDTAPTPHPTPNPQRIKFVVDPARSPENCQQSSVSGAVVWMECTRGTETSIFLSRNGGESWTRRRGPASNGILAISASEAWAWSQQALWHTVDAGRTWTQRWITVEPVHGRLRRVSV